MNSMVPPTASLKAALLAAVLAIGCSSPIPFHDNTRDSVTAGLSEVMLKSAAFSNAYSATGYIPSGVPITATLTIINPKNLTVNYTLSCSLAGSFFTSAPPTSPTLNSTTSASFSFTLATAAEHRDLVFTLGKTTPSTGKVYSNDTFTVHCDSPPNAIPAIIAGNNSSSIPYLAFQLPSTATDTDLQTAVVTWQDITHAASGTVNLTIPGPGPNVGDSPAAPGAISGTPRMHYERPASTDVYAFTVKLLDQAGQSSPTATTSSGAAQYSLTFDGNGSSSSLPSATTHNFTDTVSLPTAPTYSGYTFAGWKDLVSGVTLSPSAAQYKATVWAASINLQAQWTVSGYTVTYAMGTTATSGSVPASATSYSSGATVTVLGNTGNLAGTNVIFEGWNTNSSATGTSYAAGDTFTISANVTLYPMWFTISGTSITAIQGNPTSIVLPSSVTSIGASAFLNCTSLTSISMPGVTSIGANAFNGCSSLTSVSMPAVTTIGYGAFDKCSSLASISLPSTLTSLSTEAFQGCTQLTTITSSSSTYLVAANGSLYVGTTLWVVPAKTSGAYTIPAGLTGIDEYALDDCSLLTSITFPSSMTTISGNAFSGMSSVIAMVLPSTVTTISANAFTYAGISSVTIPSSVTLINDSAFYGCTSLTSVTMLASSPPTLSGATNFPSGATIHVPSSTAVTAYQAASGWSTFSSQIVTP
jgi:hypothetical protein